MASGYGRFIAVPLLLFLGGGLSSCSTGLGNSGPYQEAILVPFVFEDDNSAWEVGYSAQNEVQRVVEFVRPGQTVENWSELVTIQTFNKAAGVGSVEDSLAMYRQDLLSRCPDSKVNIIRQNSGDVVYEAYVMGCAEGPDEHVLARVLDGAHSQFLVQYAVREAATMAPSRRTDWIEKLMSVQVVRNP